MFTKSARFYDAIYSFKDYAAEAERLHHIIQGYKRSPGNALVDVACGTGAHMPHLRRHYAAEGLDLDPSLLEVAEQRYPGVRFHHADMLDFDLKQRFDIVTCLFSSIGYVKTPARLEQAVWNMARHLLPGGVLIIEPWLTPETCRHGLVGGNFVDLPELKIARMNVSVVDGPISRFDFHYLVATPQGVEHFIERHELGLFSHEQYEQALTACDLSVDHDPEGLMGRGLYIGVRPLAAA